MNCHLCGKKLKTYLLGPEEKICGCKDYKTPAHLTWDGEKVLKIIQKYEEEIKSLKSGCQNWKNLAEKYMDDAKELEEKATAEMKSLHATHNQAIDKWRLAEDKLRLALIALKFYAEFESDENGYGGVDGEGRYVIRLSGYKGGSYVLDKGKTAQRALKDIEDIK